MAKPASILLVEDNPGDIRLIREMLKEAFAEEGFVLDNVSSMAAALAHLAGGAVCDVVLLDLSLPDSQGLDSIRSIQSAAPQLPVVVLSGDIDEDVAISAVVAGAQDYLVKGHINAHLLRRALRVASHRKQIEQNLVREANHDDLTGLPMRNLLLDRIEQALLACARGNSRGALLFIDLDGFKEINDLHGHKAGDDVLLAAAGRLQQAVRATDTVARLGGDEFVLLLPSIDHNDDISQITQRVALAFSQPVPSGALMLGIAASIGGVIFPDEDDSAEGLLKLADAAMYRIKAARKAVRKAAGNAPTHLRYIQGLRG